MQPTEKRGWGAAQSRNKPDKIVPRYGISPQLAPARIADSQRECFNGPQPSVPAAVPMVTK